MKLNNVQIIEPENHHRYIIELINGMAELDKQIISNKHNECTTDDQHMFTSQSLNNFNNDELLELDE